MGSDLSWCAANAAPHCLALLRRARHAAFKLDAVHQHFIQHGTPCSADLSGFGDQGKSATLNDAAPGGNPGAALLVGAAGSLHVGGAGARQTERGAMIVADKSAGQAAGQAVGWREGGVPLGALMVYGGVLGDDWRTDMVIVTVWEVEEGPGGGSRIRLRCEQVQQLAAVGCGDGCYAGGGSGRGSGSCSASGFESSASSTGGDSSSAIDAGATRAAAGGGRGNGAGGDRVGLHADGIASTGADPPGSTAGSRGSTASRRPASRPAPSLGNDDFGDPISSRGAGTDGTRDDWVVGPGERRDFAACTVSANQFVVHGGFLGQRGEATDLHLCTLEPRIPTAAPAEAPQAPAAAIRAPTRRAGPAGAWCARWRCVAQAGGDLQIPSGRSHHSLCLWGARRCVVLFGGYTSGAGCLNDLWVLSLDDCTWWQPAAAGERG